MVKKDYRLPASWERFLRPLCLSIIMSSVISFVATVRAIGFSDDLLLTWLQAWGIGWAIAFPVLMIVLPLVNALLKRICKPST